MAAAGFRLATSVRIDHRGVARPASLGATPIGRLTRLPGLPTNPAKRYRDGVNSIAPFGFMRFSP